MADIDALDSRIRDVVGEDAQSIEERLERFFQHLDDRLELPATVRGSEDFGWEEHYLFGPGEHAEYEHRRQSQPSCQDVFELTSIAIDVESNWIMRHNDIAAQVKRKSDGEEFWLGLSDLEVLDKESKNNHLLRDFGTWFANVR